ncbi:flagellar protein FlaG [Solemya velesiana gill symbiont]|uniref:Flagellar biosynthesis protein FlaG n=1 Tax=Solemya velesiana gill symbiont TaxID=1918948 RepID=A0A1T2KY84_9GAMM|nr:flagellar protein FlaG [Solemya velesiana gill symbiont]OOZ37720.1 hypothetical protein BOW51_00880 [Solemya velesiana gill symbiont]
MAVDIVNINSLPPAKRPVTSSRPENVQKSSGPPQVQQAIESVASKQAEVQQDVETQNADKFVDADQLKGLLDEANQMMQVSKRKLQFSINEDTGKPVVRVYDAETKELIRQYPPDEILALARTIKEMMDEPQLGFMLDEKG